MKNKSNVCYESTSKIAISQDFEDAIVQYVNSVNKAVQGERFLVLEKLPSADSNT